MKISKFRTDPALERSGAWVRFREDARVKLARFGNQRYSARLQELLKPHAEAYGGATIPPAIVEDCQRRAMAETLVVDWDKFEDDVVDEATGEMRTVVVPHSVEKALEFLTDESWHDFFEFVLVESQQMRHFVAKSKAEAEGKPRNSSNGSGGSLPSSRSPSSRSNEPGVESRSSNGSPSSPSEPPTVGALSGSSTTSTSG